MSLYACRDHYNPVTPRGTGCPECTREQRHRGKPAKRRRAPVAEPLDLIAARLGQTAE